MTKNELKAALDLAGVSYAKKANLETLQALFDALPQADAPTPEEATAAQTPAQEAPATEEGTGLKIEKDRSEQNGIKRSSIGGKCRAIWDALDEYRAETGELPTSKTVKELAADSGWNPNNASIEFYQWRKYHGIGKQA